jgi:hypothetical protein
VREDRIVRNEVLHRELNERMRQVETELAADGVVEPLELGEYFCECGLMECTDKIRVTPAEYEAVRTDPARFLILPEHLIADVERIVDQTDRYATVEKLPAERAIAIEHDPRS